MLFAYGSLPTTPQALVPPLLLREIVYTSFKRVNGTVFVPGYSLNSYVDAFRKVGRAISNTLIIPGISLVVIVFFAALIAYITVRRRNAFIGVADSISMVPYMIPGSVVGITLLIAFSKPPILLSSTMLIMIIGLVLRRLPYTIRSSVAVLSLGSSFNHARNPHRDFSAHIQSLWVRFPAALLRKRERAVVGS